MFKNFIASLIIVVCISLPIKGTDAPLPFDQAGFSSIGPGRTMSPIEHEMRRRAANSLLEIYGYLNSKGRFPTLSLCEGGVEQEEFLVPSEWQQTLVLRAGIMLRLVMPGLGVPFSQCINSIRICSELVIDCTNAAEIAAMSVMSAFFSDVRVDFMQKYLRSKMKEDAPMSDLQSLMRSYIYAVNISTAEINNLELSDFFYIPGHPKYSDEKHLNYARGENVFCVGFKGGYPVFVGFGDFFKDGPKTIAQVQENLAQNYLKQEENQAIDAELFERVLQEIKQQPFFLGKLDTQTIIKRTTPSVHVVENK